MTTYHLTGDFHLPSATPSYAPSLPLEPIHGCLNFHPDILKSRLQASIEWTLFSHVNSACSIVLDAVDIHILQLTSSQSDFTTDYDGHKLQITWKTPIAKGGKVKIKIDYQVERPIAGCYFGGPSPELPERGHWMATDHETSRARYWLPCIDHSNVRTTWDIFITHSTEHTAVSAGYLVECVSLDEQVSRSHWKQTKRCPVYLLAIIVGEYERVDFEPLRDIPLAGFAPKGNDPADIERAFAPTKSLIEFAETLLGPLPWDKYYQFAAPGIGGAMENISLVSWDSRLLFDENMHKDLGFLFDQINLHELAHTWFGDLIVCRDYAHVWLKESWATYFETVWMEHTNTVDRHHEELISQRESYFGEVKGRYSRPIMTRMFDSAWKMYDMHLYPGGAVRLHQLRNKIGSEEFWNATKDYVNTYAESVVETDDFRHIMEKHSGQSLAHYFDQWFGRAGYPKIQITQEHFTDTGIMRLQIKQSIVGGEKDDSPFDFTLQIAVQGDDQAWSRHTLQIDDFTHTFRFEADSKPRQIIIDPECVAVVEIEFDPGLSVNQTMFEESPYWHGKLQAGRNLVKQDSKQALRTLQTHFASQPIGIRDKIAKAMTKSKSLAAESLLCEWSSSETVAQVQASIITALGSHRSANSAQALCKIIQSEHHSHRIRGLALNGLAKQGRYRDLDLLLDYTNHTGWRHSIRAAAIQALGHTDSCDALNRLIEVLQSDNEAFRTKMLACSATASCAKRISKLAEGRAKEALIDTLKNSHPSVRLSAVNGLKSLGHPDAAIHIEAVRPQIPIQNAPDLSRAIKSCTGGTSTSPNSSLTKRIESLEEDNRKLQSELDDIKAQLNISKT